MTMRHLSDYRLDALAAGRATPETSAHLAECPECQARWAELEHVDAYLRVQSRFGTVREYVKRDGALARRRRRTRYFVIAPLAAAALAVVLLAPPLLLPHRHGRRQERMATRTTAPSIEIVRVNGPGTVRPGDRVVIQLTPTGMKQALVMGIDESGAVAQIWPASGDHSGSIPAARRAALTPGSWAPWKSTRVEVFLSNETVSADDVRSAVLRARTREPATPIRSLRIDDVSGQAARLSSFIDVEASRGQGQPLGAPR
jgi:hypothetical protein